MPGKQSIVLYDNDCGFCIACVRFFKKRDRSGRYQFLKGNESQDFRKQLGQATFALPLESVMLVENGQVFERSDAVIRILVGTGGLGRLGALAYLVPRFIRDAVYRFIARNRYLLGGKKQCGLD